MAENKRVQRRRGWDAQTTAWNRPIIDTTPTVPTIVQAEPIVTVLPIVSAPTATTEVKSATPEIIITSEEGIPVEVMSDLIFENIGGQELINISRTDIINGVTVGYQPIKNLQYIQQQFNPNNIVPLQLTSDRFFANFSIKLEDKVDPSAENVYRDTNGDIIVELINLNSDEQVEVEILTNGIIYEVDNL